MQLGGSIVQRALLAWLLLLFVVSPQMAGAQAFPRQPRSWTPPATLLDGIDIFLRQQASHFVLSGPRYVTTYRVPAGLGNLAFRADTYDTAIAAIYLLER